MPIYIMLANYTQQGISKIKEDPQRLEGAKRAFESAGGKLLELYLTMGQYDMVIIGELPDDKAMATLALYMGSFATIRTETLRAFTEDEYREIIASIP